MIILFYLIILFIVNLYSIYKKKSNHILYINLLSIWVLFFTNIQNPDYDNYVYMYYNGSNRVEWLFLVVNNLCFKLGFSYHLYLAIISGCAFAIVGKFIKKNSLNPSLVLLLYIFFPFMIDIVQIRNFLVSVILLYSIQFILAGSKKDLFKFFVCIIIASGFQYIAYFYLLFLLIPFLMKTMKMFNVRARYIIFFVYLCTIILFSNKIILSSIGNVFTYFIDDYYQSYFEIKTNLGYIFYWIFQLASIYLLVYSHKIIKGKVLQKNGEKSHILIRFSEVTLIINIILILAFPLYVFRTIFTRIIRNILILNFVTYSNAFSLLRRDSAKKTLFLCSVLILNFLILYVDIVAGYYNEIVYPFFTKSLLFDFLEFIINILV